MSLTVTAQNGVPLPVDDLAQVFAYNVDGKVSSITVAYRGVTYIQTFTYSAGVLTNISQWVNQ